MVIMDTEICTPCTPTTLETYFQDIWSCLPILHFCQPVTIQLSLLLNHRIPLSSSRCSLGDAEINLKKSSRVCLTVLSTAKWGGIGNQRILSISLSE